MLSIIWIDKKKKYRPIIRMLTTEIDTDDDGTQETLWEVGMQFFVDYEDETSLDFYGYSLNKKEETIKFEYIKRGIRG